MDIDVGDVGTSEIEIVQTAGRRRRCDIEESETLINGVPKTLGFAELNCKSLVYDHCYGHDAVPQARRVHGELRNAINDNVAQL